MERLLKVEDVAVLLQLGKRTIFRLSYSQDGFPPPLRVGGSVRWRMKDIEAYIESLKK